MRSSPDPGAVVHLVDDEAVVRDAIAWLLRSRRLLSEAHASAEAFLDWLAASRAGRADDWPSTPSCLLLDLRMGAMSGLALFDRLAGEGLTDAMPVVFLTGHGDVPTAVAAVKRGAFDFFEKPFSNNLLVDRLEAALVSSANALRDRRDRRAAARLQDALGDREREAMRLIAQGIPNKLIAQAMQVSVRTVEAHRSSVFEKLRVRSAAELANYLHRIDS